MKQKPARSLLFFCLKNTVNCNQSPHVKRKHTAQVQFFLSFQLPAKNTWQLVSVMTIWRPTNHRLLFQGCYTTIVFSWQLKLFWVELLSSNVHTVYAQCDRVWSVSVSAGWLRTFFSPSRPHPAGMLYKQEVCPPSATSLIVFIALSIPQATLIPQIP